MKYAFWTFGALALAFLYLAGVARGLWQPLTRPAGVSKSARFVPLLDAYWVDCSVNHKLDVNECAAWDADGKFLGKGQLRLEDENRAATEQELHPSVVSASGGMILSISLFERPGRNAFAKRLVPIPVPVFTVR